MLPTGIAAQPVGGTRASRLRALLPDVQSPVVLLAGACSCDLVRERPPDPIEGERYLRTRYFKAGLSRSEIVAQLERHRRRSGPGSRSHYQLATALAYFVAEHARNAGPSLYLLSFETPGARTADPPEVPARSPRVKTAAQVRQDPTVWLEEDLPVLVVR